VIDKNAPHHARTQRQEVHAVAKRNDLPFEKTDERFVDQRSRLQRVTGPLVRHVEHRDTMQLTLDERHELLQREIIAAGPLCQ